MTTGPLLVPEYGARSLSDVVPGVAAALGVEPRTEGGLTLPDAGAYVIFLIDGMGEMLLRRHPDLAPFLSSLTGPGGTAGVPSTTATSLTSLGTALVPGQHGLIGYTSRVPETGRLINHLSWEGGVDPVEWQPHETAFAKLVGQGVEVTVVNRREFDGSGFTVAGQRGARYLRANLVGERIVGVVEASRHTPSLTYVYDGDLDWTGHAHGVDSPQWRQQLTSVDQLAQQMREALPQSVRMLVVADHGMIDSSPAHHIELDDEPELKDGLVLVAGEARFRQLYCRDGALDDVLAMWRERLGDRATVLPRQEAIDRGWFGEVEERVRLRIGEVVVACHGDTAVMSTSHFPQERTLVGLHGSLTEDEMRIPILIA